MISTSGIIKPTPLVASLPPGTTEQLARLADLNDVGPITGGLLPALKKITDTVAEVPVESTFI